MIRTSPTPSSDEFLRLFDRDPARAIELYKDLSRRLVKFFECRGCSEPEDLAQETFTRGFSRILTVDLKVEPSHYFFGVAKNIAMEDRRQARRRSRTVSFDENVAVDPGQYDPSANEPEQEDAAYEIPKLPPVGRVPDDPDEARKLLQTLMRQRLSRADAKLVIRYLNGKAAGRADLARELGVDGGALRVRFCRLKKRLME